MSIPRPPVLLDFVNGGGFLDNRLVFTRAAGTNGRATFIDNRGFMVDAVNNVPRFDHTLAGSPLGLLMEFGTTGNYVTNPRNEGSTGTALTIGNLPASQVADGLTGNLSVERLADRSIRGMNFAAYRFSGTTTQIVSFHLRTGVDLVSSSGQPWNYSAYIALDAGSTLTGVTQALIQCVSVGGTAVGQTDLIPLLVPGQDVFRTFAPVTLDAGTTHVRPRIRFQIASGATPNFTILVGPTQLENRLFPTSQILNIPGTTNQNCFRAAESLVGYLADFGLPNLGNEGSLVCDFRTGFAQSGTTQCPLEIGDNTVDNFIRLSRRTQADFFVNLTAGGVSHVQAYTGGTLDDYTRYVSAFAWRVNDTAHSVNGGAAVADTTAPSMPTTATQFNIGTVFNLGQPLGGHVRRVALYPDRLSNAVLQQLSA